MENKEEDFRTTINLDKLTLEALKRIMKYIGSKQRSTAIRFSILRADEEIEKKK